MCVCVSAMDVRFGPTVDFGCPPLFPFRLAPTRFPFLFFLFYSSFSLIPIEMWAVAELCDMRMYICINKSEQETSTRTLPISCLQQTM